MVFETKLTINKKFTKNLNTSKTVSKPVNNIYVHFILMSTAKKGKVLKSNSVGWLNFKGWF